MPIRQPLPANPRPVDGIDPDAARALFGEDRKSKCILTAVIQLLKANAESDPTAQFERCWKALNRLYSFIGGASTDFENQKALRQFVLDNPGSFPCSLSIVTGLTQERLRNEFRWRAMILNNHPTLRRSNSLADFIRRYEDCRVMLLLKELLPYRQDHLSTLGRYNEVLTHINHHITQDTTNDSELLALLAIKYAYFVRNKLMHGESTDVSFSVLPNSEELELSWVAKLTQRFVVELLNAGKLY